MTWEPWHPSAPPKVYDNWKPLDVATLEQISTARASIVVDAEYVDSYLQAASMVRSDKRGNLWSSARYGQEFGELEGREWLKNASRNPSDVRIPLGIILGDGGKSVKDFARHVSWFDGADPANADITDSEPEEPEESQEPEEPKFA